MRPVCGFISAQAFCNRLSRISSRRRNPSARSAMASCWSARPQKTTTLTKQMELIAWRLTRLYLDDYYRTYQTTVEDEVR